MNLARWWDNSLQINAKIWHGLKSSSRWQGFKKCTLIYIPASTRSAFQVLSTKSLVIPFLSTIYAFVNESRKELRSKEANVNAWKGCSQNAGDETVTRMWNCGWEENEFRFQDFQESRGKTKDLSLLFKQWAILSWDCILYTHTVMYSWLDVFFNKKSIYFSLPVLYFST